MRVRLKNISKVIMGQSIDEKDMMSVETQNCFEFHQGNKLFNKKSEIGKSNVFGLKGKLGHSGDILFSVRAPVGDIAILNRNIIIGRGLAAIRPTKKTDINYLYYLLQTKVNELKEQQTGTTFDSITTTDLKNLIVANISLEQQIAIANFLDIETSKIDKKIDILSQKLEKLEEYKQSVIFETVTKGLDNSVPMKDSGIEWIGDIPTHWEVKRVKDVLENMGGGNYGNDEGNDGLVIPCISISDFKNGNLYHNKNIKMNRVYQKNNILNKGTILIEKSGGGEKVPVGRIIYVKNDIEAYYTNFVQGIKIRKENSNYIFYCLQTIHKNKLHMNFVKQTTGLQNFEFNKFSNNFFIAIPKYNEQEKIVDFLNSKTSNIKQHQLIITKQIALLKEYKQSLIYEAVTGKTNIINTNDQLKNFINTIPYEKDTDLKDIIISKVIKELNIDYDEVINLILKLIDEKYLIKISCNQIGSMKVVNYGNGNSLIKDDKKYISIKVRIK